MLPRVPVRVSQPRWPLRSNTNITGLAKKTQNASHTRILSTSFSKYTSRESYLVLRQVFAALFVSFGPRKRASKARSRTVPEAKYSILEKFPIASPCSMPWGHESKVAGILTAPFKGNSDDSHRLPSQVLCSS